MIRHITESIMVKPVSLILATSILFMSFAPYQETVTLSAGTLIILETVQAFQSDLATPGMTIDFKVRSDVKVKGEVVIKAGTMAKGQVVRAQKAKGVGKAGHIEIQVRSVEAVDGQEVLLTGGNLHQEGEDKQTAALVLGILLCILFLTKKGKNAEIPVGTRVDGTVATNMEIEV